MIIGKTTRGGQVTGHRSPIHGGPYLIVREPGPTFDRIATVVFDEAELKRYFKRLGYVKQDEAKVEVPA